TDAGNGVVLCFVECAARSGAWVFHAEADALGLPVSLRKRLQPLHAHVGDFQHQAAGPTRHVDAGAPATRVAAIEALPVVGDPLAVLRDGGRQAAPRAPALAVAPMLAVRWEDGMRFPHPQPVARLAEGAAGRNRREAVGRRLPVSVGQPQYPPRLRL